MATLGESPISISLLCLTVMAAASGVLEALNGSSGCIESERAALLAFKSSITDSGSRLQSWKGEDCCSWMGVRCSNNTGHVLHLNLRNYKEDSQSLRGEINRSLLSLTRLRYLDLGNNNFDFSPIPDFFSSFKSLRYLNLENSAFGGRVPPQLGNLSSLRYLNIGFNGNLYCTTLDWLSLLSSLEFLDISWVFLGKADGDWLRVVAKLSSLKVLRLRSCGLGSIDSSISHANLSKLVEVDLGQNELNSTAPQWLWNATQITVLRLDSNLFHGHILDAVQNMTFLSSLVLQSNRFVGNASGEIFTKLCYLNTLNLEFNLFSGDFNKIVQGLRCSWSTLQNLGMGRNQIRGTLSGSVEYLTSLEFLSLSYNSMDGPIPEEISNLSNLSNLYLDYNSFHGNITEAHFANLRGLQTLDLSSNSLSMDLKEDWVAPFQLETLSLSSCLLGPRFPAWLRWQNNLSNLAIANAGISDTMPEWFVNISSNLMGLDLSFNRMRGKLPQSLSVQKYADVGLQNNLFEGQIPPYLLYNAARLNLGDNRFEGKFPSSNEPLHLKFLYLQNNFINSSIPHFICTAASLKFIDMSNNLLSGEIPNCLSKSLWFVNLSNNMLHGQIPDSIYSLKMLQVLDLSNNELTGKLPDSPQQCKSLAILSLSNNNLEGNVPAWLGKELPNLQILLLRSNLLSSSMMQLNELQILDLANNSLSSSISKSFMNLTSSNSKTRPISLEKQCMFISVCKYTYFPLVLTTKGQQLNYTANLIRFKSIDLSSNNLSGEIPYQVCALKELTNLNLSNNHFTGNIPDCIADMRLLESLDLSNNQLWGEIPPSLASLSFLSYLNLSYNNLSGRIPSGNQLQTLNADPSIYIGNDELCGIPTLRTCSSNADQPGIIPAIGAEEMNNTDDEVRWFYLGMATGFALGLCGILAMHLFYYDRIKPCLFRINNFFDMYETSIQA